LREILAGGTPAFRLRCLGVFGYEDEDDQFWQKSSRRAKKFEVSSTESTESTEEDGEDQERIFLKLRS
jgi:hypothetical protein